MCQKRKQVLNNKASFIPVTFSARKYNALSHIVIILRKVLTVLKINRAQIGQNKKSNLPKIKHYAKVNHLELFPRNSNLDNNRSRHIPPWQKGGGGFLGCFCVTRFYDNGQNNFSNGAAWSTMKNDVTDGAICLSLSFARHFS